MNENEIYSVMKKRIQIIILLFVCSLSANAQYISEILEYRPAPGQLINYSPWGNPSDAASIKGGVNGSLCLGAFGGYVVFKFENPVENHPENPFGIDFSIFGNPQQNWAEPGVVSVMKDENGNDQPDDTWYELAGSDYWFSSTVKDYQLTYTNPGGEIAADVSWNDNLGNSGFIFANALHTQPYYPIHDSFPSINPDSYSLSGTLIKQILDTTNPGFVLSPQRGFGYADNNLRGGQPYTLPDNPYTAEKENSGGDTFDISWAVDEAGNYVDIDEIDFVKVQNAVLDNAGWLGEISTEITGAADVEPNASVSGNLWLIVIKDLPPIIGTRLFQLEVFVFYKGRPVTEEQIVWQTNTGQAFIDENFMLTLAASGALEITAKLLNYPEITATASAIIDLSSSAISESSMQNKILVWPNPADDIIHISIIEKGNLEILDLNGNIFYQKVDFDGQSPIDISEISAGFYFVRIHSDDFYRTIKLLKN
ncbi:MAG: T9SS type A sorting domain-containing protein [Bacteroidales bacterium]|nr:T9SS type A sorting domain-containing protein [Bacteroidales bacterium]